MTERHPVRVLTELVANQIAAGEVVERPASVVKELVENALDADATRITVSIEQGGAKRICVEDNGYGMTRDDAIASLERQATSKIARSEDIERIATFGFRGEAIPSIASVSRFSLTSRARGEEVATVLALTGGELEGITEAGHPTGTSVEVSDLFFNVPARRKFLRAASTEQIRIRQILIAIALANPTFAFRFSADDHELFRLPEGDTLAERIRTLLGEPTAEALLPIDHTRGAVHVHGFISRPDFQRNASSEQYVFINRRPASSPQIQYALREAYPSKERRPVVVLFIDLPPEEVDVNVHPAKREVRFRHGDAVIASVIAAVIAALTMPAPQETVTPQPLDATTFKRVPLPVPPLSPIAPMPTPQAPTPRQMGLQLPEASVTAYPVLRDVPQTLHPITPPAPAPVEAVTLGAVGPWKWLRIADLLQPGYWLVVTDQGIVTVDAKNALERILYERFNATATASASQQLLLPETFHLSSADAERVRRFLPELQACGFGINDFGNDTFLVDGLPVALAEISAATLIADLAVELDQTGVKRGVESGQREMVARAAAKAACRSLPVTTLDAAKTLMLQLAQCAMPYATPRGRPTMILTTYRELSRRFQREG